SHLRTLRSITVQDLNW
nr:immunoglobulin heavy chain junction region [Mus musculus]